MLTEKESFPIHFFIRLNSMIGILPVTLNRIDGSLRMRLEKNGVKIWISKLVFLLVLLDSLYVGGRLVESILNKDDKDCGLEAKQNSNFQQRLCVHYCCWTIAALAEICGWRTLFLHSATNVTLFNSVYEQEEIEEEAQEMKDGDADDAVSSVKEVRKGEPESWNGYGRYYKPWRFSSLEFPALYLSSIPLPSIVLVCALCLWDQERPQLLYTALPASYQNGFVFATLFVVETFFFNFDVSVTCYSFLIQSLVLQKVDLELKLLKEMLKTNECDAEKEEREGNMQKIMVKLRKLSLLLHLLNASHSGNILVFKSLFLLSFPIFFLFQAIILFKQDPLISFVNLYFALEAMFCFLALYARAFTLSDEFEEVRQGILSKSNAITLQPRQSQKIVGSTKIKNGSGPRKVPNSVEKQLMAIPHMGIRVGGFSQMDRQSPLNYLQFIIENLASLLIAHMH